MANLYIHFPFCKQACHYCNFHFSTKKIDSGGMLDLINKELKIRGILLTMYDKRNKLSSQVEKEARDYFSDKVYSTVIPRNVRLSEAPSHGIPVLVYDKSCPGSKSYFNFTDEFILQENKIGSAA